MYKVVWIARYRQGLTKQEGSDYWATLHGPPMKAFDVTQMWGAALKENVVIDPQLVGA